MNEISADHKKMENEKEELFHFMKVINAFKAYRRTSLRVFDVCEENFSKLPDRHKTMLPNHLKYIEKARVCVDYNATVIREITNYCSNMFENKEYKEIEEHVPHSSFDMEKVKTTLRQIVRDWSSEGEEERSMCYKPIIDEIVKRIPNKTPDKDSSKQKEECIKILVPGCGLGRLAWELARLGYCCQGNEFSFFMLFTSYFIINRTQSTSLNDFHQFTVYPWVEKRCNNKSWKNILKPVKFPDVNPSSLPHENKFSIAAGDFLEIYTDSDTWECIATCYFIDTAHNIIDYIERMFDILKPGGLWVNLGPLLYHFSGMANECSVELSYEEVRTVVEKVGFIIKKEDWIKGKYINEASSMMQYEYTCVLLVAEKPSPQ